MHDIIAIGSSLIDTFVQSNQLTVSEDEGGSVVCKIVGDKVIADEYNIHTGGGASNTAVGFARMGFSTAVVSEMGQDVLSKVLITDFEKEKVDTGFLIQEKKEQTGGSIILLGADGARSVLVHRGAASMLDPEDIPVADIKQAQWVHMSSVGGKVDTLETIFQAVSQSNVRLSWNPGGQEIDLLVQGLFNFEANLCTLFFVNKKEWERLTPRHNMIREHVETVVITDGERGGSVCKQNEDPVQYKAKQVATTVDVTGAGDAFVVGYVSALLKHEDVGQSCAWGSANAASVVQHFGAKSGLLDHKTIQS